jgi:hypothetical protein
MVRQAEEEEGIENCREEDEERKEVEGLNMDQSVSRQVMKEKDPNLFDLQSNEDLQILQDDGVAQPGNESPNPNVLLYQSNAA